MHCLEIVLSFLLFEVKAQQYFVSSRYMFLDKNTLLKIWLNPGLNLTMFRGMGPDGLKTTSCTEKVPGEAGSLYTVLSKSCSLRKYSSYSAILPKPNETKWGHNWKCKKAQPMA